MLGLVAVQLTTATRLLAEDDEVSDGPPGSPLVQNLNDSSTPDTTFDAGASGDADKRVGVILAAHPDRDLVICLAGCGGGPKLVALRARQTVEQVVAAAAAGGRIAPASATVPAGSSATPVGSDGALPPATFGDVICLAGCGGAPGGILQRGVRMSWVGSGASGELAAALRSVADRLAARKHEGTGVPAAEIPEAANRIWVSAHARRLLDDGEGIAGSVELPQVLAMLVRSAGGVRAPAAR